MSAEFIPSLISGVVGTGCSAVISVAHFMVTTSRHAVRIEALERQVSDLNQQIRTLDRSYVPRNELTALIDALKQNQDRMSAVLERIENRLDMLLVPARSNS